MAGTPIIEAEDVTKRFGEHQVLTRVRLPVMERDVVCVDVAHHALVGITVRRSSRCHVGAITVPAG